MTSLAADMPTVLEIRTKPNRHFPFLARHPWVLVGALAPSQSEPKPSVPVSADPNLDASPKNSQTRDSQTRDSQTQDSQTNGEAAPAESSEPISDPNPLGHLQHVELLDHDGNWIGRGILNPRSRLRIRLYSFDVDQPISAEMFGQRIDQAIARRATTSQLNSRGGQRLVFSESDRLSGLIVDRYANCLSVQFTAAAMLPHAEFLIDRVVAKLSEHGVKIDRIIARMDAATQKHEGVDEEQLACLSQWASDIEDDETTNEANENGDSLIWYQHGDLEMAIDVRQGQKTGGYLDQQDNHRVAASYLKGRRVLDICTYTGGFALAAAQAGASEVIAIDSSERSLRLAAINAERNGLNQVSFVKADCFDDLKRRCEAGEKFDAIVLDPPRFAGSRRQVDAAIRAYTRLNASAVDLLNPGGILVTCSCSGHVSRADFLNMLVDVGRRRGRDLVILENRGPSPDHPSSVSCPESNYLKCMIVEAV